MLPARATGPLLPSRRHEDPAVAAFTSPPTSLRLYRVSSPTTMRWFENGVFFGDFA